MSSGLYSGVSGLAIGTGLYKGAAGLWGNSSGLISGWGSFSPASLFASGEQGFIYDPSDFSTLYQDPAGTTPVTAVGQTVGLVLDKSKGLVLGPELVVNGDFNSGTTGWQLGTGVTVSGGSASFSSAGGAALIQILNGISTTPGVFYEIRFDVTRVSGSISCRLASTGSVPITVSASGAYRFVERVGSAAPLNTLIVFDGISFTGSIDNISVRELPGNHATQSVLASRPILAREPLGGRRNLLTYTEQFDNAAWSKSNATVTANATTSPDGTVDADKLVENTTPTAIHAVTSASATLAATTAYTATIYAKKAERNWMYFQFSTTPFGTTTRCWFDLDTGVVGTATNCTGSITPVGGGWYRCAVTTTTTVGGNGSAALYLSTGNNITSYTGDGTSGIYLWGAQLEPGSTATAYQRVTSVYDVTEAGKADLHYLLFDGSDDFLVTPTITPGIDKAQVFAGVRKLSDAAFAVLLETSTASSTNNGAIGLFAPNGASGEYSFRSRGTITSNAIEAPASNLSPKTNVITGIGDIGADVTRLRVNGSQVAADTTTDQGTGNYLAYPLYVGRRGGTTNPLNGRIYSLIVRFGANLTADQIAQTENWVAGKTGIYTLEQLSRLNAQTADGTLYSAYAASDAESNNYPVNSTVLAANGTSYNVI